MTQVESRTERLERCLEAVEQGPGSAVACYNLGLAYQKMGRFGEAEQAYRKAVELDATLAEAWVNLGGVRLHGWDFEGCLEASLKAVELRDDLVVAHHNLGQAYLYLNDPENLVRCARKVLELDADHPPSHYYAAVGLLALGELGAAERHLGRAMELGHRPTAEFLRALERAQRSKGEGRIDMVEIGGGEIPGRAKEG